MWTAGVASTCGWRLTVWMLQNGGSAPDVVATADAGVIHLAKFFCHFAKYLFAPGLQALVAEIVLIGFIQRESDKQLAVGNDRF